MNSALGRRLFDAIILAILYAEVAAAAWLAWRLFTGHTGLSAWLWPVGVLVGLVLTLVVSVLLVMHFDPYGRAGLEGIGCEDLDDPDGADNCPVIATTDPLDN